jgi:hypothetical protein
MTLHRWFRASIVASTLGLLILAGCDVDNHPTATGKGIRPAETNGTDDPGAVNAGGPGAQGQTPK